MFEFHAISPNGIADGNKTTWGHGQSHPEDDQENPWVPSGYVKIAIENGPVEIVDFPIKNKVIFHS